MCSKLACVDGTSDGSAAHTNMFNFHTENAVQMYVFVSRETRDYGINSSVMLVKTDEEKDMTKRMSIGYWNAGARTKNPSQRCEEMEAGSPVAFHMQVRQPAHSLAAETKSSSCQKKCRKGKEGSFKSLRFTFLTGKNHQHRYKNSTIFIPYLYPFLDFKSPKLRKQTS